MTDRPHRLPQRPSAAERADDFDVLSSVLQSVRLTGSMLFLVEAHAPWMTHAPRASAFAQAVLPTVEHLISYHVVTRGRCWGNLAGEAPQPLQTGDILVVPHGDAYALAMPADAAAHYGDDEAVAFFRQMSAGELPTVVNEGGEGEQTEFICGFLGCDRRPFNPILAALPRMIVLSRASGAGGRLAHLVDFALAALRQRSAGNLVVLQRLAELMFVEVARCHLGQLDPEGSTWLAGLRDPLVGRALACLHREPASAWKLDSLAARLGTSRTTLAERFARYVGQPPMQYLIAWRMQLAARLLHDASTKVHAVAEAVGYESEAAFSRAFRRHTGLSPQRWRRRAERHDGPAS